MFPGLNITLATGGAVLLAGVVALLLIVRGDLVPANTGLDRLRQRLGQERWIVGGALGMGVLAFALKMIVLLILSTFPERTITPLLTKETVLPVNTDFTTGRASHHRWKALPLQAPYPPGDPPTEAKIALGARLFQEPRLSRDGSLTCASCHAIVAQAGADGRRTALGIDKQRGSRNTPTVWNAAFQSRLFWDGRAKSLEDQALGPILNPIEMGMPSIETAADRLRADPTYRTAFSVAFGSNVPINGDSIARAIAAYERTLITPNTRYDQFIRGKTSALTEREKRGMWLFETVGCVQCHAGPNFSGASLIGPYRPFAPLHAVGTEADRTYHLTADKGKNALWRIPSLRNVALTAPYLHNGSVDTLEEAVRLMAKNQLGITLSGSAPTPAPHWLTQAGTFASPHPRSLNDEDIHAIVAFLGSLSAPRLERKTAP
ncbi:cytochrome-c peroxidase [Rhodospirillum sp. A1_3_36]|uniref:cytochrome-c peroxidase n=1 Tax=Rhodospirillum sp. A1_3_36 TaxID=3391666 RepID=UPI0039A6F3CF